MVLGPLINSPQLGEDVGHDLSELGLDFTVPAVPLGKTWLSRRIYPLITPLLGNTRAKGAHKLVRMWDNDWPSIYQFDHGLKACRSIAIADTPDKEQEAALSAHPLWTPLSGSQHTLPLATTADRPRLTTPCEGEVSGMWTLSKLLLLPLGGNLPIGFGMAVNDLFSWETFLIQLATHHGQSLASHVEGWLQAPWCDSWFNGARRDTKNFMLPVVSWSQLHDTLAPLVVPDDSIDPRRYAFLVLMWQGIARLHTDKLTYRTLPRLTDYVCARMRWYFEKRDAVLQSTGNLPPFLPTDSFLSYRLCPPSVKEWLQKLDIHVLADALPAFPWLNDFIPLVIDPADNYSQVALTPASTAAA